MTKIQKISKIDYCDTCYTGDTCRVLDDVQNDWQDGAACVTCGTEAP